MEPRDDQARTALVTGAAGGIGSAVVRGFLSEGLSVVATDLDRAGLSRSLREFEGDDRLQLVAADLSDPRAPAEVVRSARDRFGRLDVVASVAGVTQIGRTHTLTAAEWDRVHAINARAPFLLSQAAMPDLERNRGCIVAVSSIAGMQGWAYSSAYAASKAGLIGLMRSLAREHGAAGVRVNVVAPGGVMTTMSDVVRSGWDSTEDLDPAVRKPSTGLEGRRAEPSEVADAVIYLSSSKAAFINGAVVPIDGGAFA